LAKVPVRKQNMKRPAPQKENPAEQDFEDVQQRSDDNLPDDHQVNESEKLDDTIQPSEIQTTNDTKS
jgi:hypothetical protein